MIKVALLELCNELLSEIVAHVGKVKDLKALSLVHRAFTDLCQKSLFDLVRIYEWNRGLTTVYDTCDRDPRKAAYIRHIAVMVPDDSKRIFNPLADARFLSLMSLISDSPTPIRSCTLQNVDNSPGRSTRVVMDCILTASISQTLTELSLCNCELPTAAISQCFQLKKLDISEVRLIELAGASTNHTESGQRPHLTSLEYTTSTETIKAMLPSLGAETSIAELSALRILRLIPEHQEDMAQAQAILDAAQDSLRELHLVDGTHEPMYNLNRHFFLANLLNFRHLSRLRYFELRASVYDSDPGRMKVVDDMIIMLSRIPAVNSLDTFNYRVQAKGRPPFTNAMSQNWHGLAKEVIRMSAGRPFRFLFEMDTGIEESSSDSDTWYYTRDQLRPHHKKLYSHVCHEMRDIKTHKNIKWVCQNEINGFKWF
ncbi:hypothetical protein BKA70DRAFT_691707 [Coprinopsis sp. MPI-PUGE-AT-0042]|nr:hypothetical protein BKA70DRAFT_691707 [Coprinopsis sp. MPI-PUGE-AT-0042]